MAYCTSYVYKNNKATKARNLYTIKDYHKLAVYMLSKYGTAWYQECVLTYGPSKANRLRRSL